MQLAALLGKDMVHIRKTDEVPARSSIIDVAIAVMGKTQHDAAQDFRRLSDQYPKWEQIVPSTNSRVGASGTRLCQTFGALSNLYFCRQGIMLGERSAGRYHGDLIRRRHHHAAGQPCWI